MKPDQQCKKCGQGAYHNAGISKTKFTAEYPNGIPWENVKCGNPACKFIEWMNQDNKPQSAPLPQKQDPLMIIVENQNEMLKRLQNVLDILQPKHSGFAITKEDKKTEDFTKISDLLPKDDINPKEIPF